jgi:hypothetical protein
MTIEQARTIDLGWVYIQRRLTTKGYLYEVTGLKSRHVYQTFTVDTQADTYANSEASLYDDHQVKS